MARAPAFPASPQAGVVRLVAKRLRGHVWECPRLFALVQEFERGLG